MIEAYRCRNCSGVVKPAGEDAQNYGFRWVHSDDLPMCVQTTAYPDYDEPVEAE